MWQALSSLSVMVVALSASTALAHPGHGAEGQSYDLWHYLVEPTHAVVVFGVVLLLWVVHQPIRRVMLKCTIFVRIDA